MIKDNVLAIQEQISSICKRLGRNPEEITLVGITKYVQADQVKELLAAGVTHIGENRVMDAKSKFSCLTDLSFTRHMVGHLQTNKVKLALELFDLIHSVDTRKLAWEIDKQAAKKQKQVNVLLQVNTAYEEQKYGLAPDQVFGLIEEICRLEHVRIQGLMTMAPFVDNQDVIRQCFKDLKQIFDAVKDRYVKHPSVEMKYLSMGMTADFEIALEEGSTMLRVGRALFA